MDGASQRCAERSKLSGRPRYHSEINDKKLSTKKGIQEGLKNMREYIEEHFYSLP